MAFPLLGLVAGLFKNPIISAVADATIGAVKHNLEKKKIIRAAEIEAARLLTLQRYKPQCKCRLHK